MLAFWILGSLALLSALAVVVLPNALHSALSLAVNLVSVAAIYALLGAHFLAAVQVIVYAGAIMVLVVFVLMLLNLKSERHSIPDILFLLTSAAIALFCANLVVPLLDHEFGGKILLTTNQASSDDAVAIGKKIFEEQAFLFQLTGIALMTALVGSIMLASKRKHGNQGKAGESQK